MAPSGDLQAAADLWVDRIGEVPWGPVQSTR